MEYKHIKDIDFEANINSKVYGIFLARNVEVKLQKDGVTKYIDVNMCDKDVTMNAKKFGATDLEIEMMKNGDAFIKYGSNNPVIHNKYISLDEKENKFIIKETCFLLCNKIRSININEIVDVYYGMSYSKYNDKYKIKPQTEDCCLSIETKKRIYDLRSKNVTQCTQWYKGIKYLIKKYKTSTNNKNNINSIANNNNQDKISSIWINDIIPNPQIEINRISTIYLDYSNSLMIIIKAKEYTYYYYL